MESGEEYCLLGIDYFTRKLFGEHIQKKSSFDIINSLKKWFKEEGMAE